MKKIVLIGGGHGLSNIVKGFKEEDIDLSIIVSSTDDGGHTGKLRSEFGVLAVGDLRMVLSSLLDDNSFLKEILDYRFPYLHGVSNVSLGNLVITSLLLKYKDIDKVIECFKEKAGIASSVFLSCNNSLGICAKTFDKEVIKGECIIGESNKKIESLYIEEKAVCNEVMLDKIERADIIVLCPGSLYTSLGAVLCVEQVKQSILKCRGNIVYVCNIMTQNGETSGYNVEDHEFAISNMIGRNIDRVIVNNGTIDEEILNKYKEENSELVKWETIKNHYEFYDLVDVNEGKVRHNSDLTRKIILSSDRQNKNIVL